MSRVIFRVSCRFFKPKFFHTIFFSTQILPEKPKQIAKMVHVAIIGAPNSGKSTLINNIVERKVCASSNKVHTTTKLARAMCFQEDTQIIFLDTPGIVTKTEQKKYNLPESMVGAYHKGLRCADVIGVVHDVSNRHTKDNLHKDVVALLHSAESIPSFLIVNKIDKLESKRQLLYLIRNLTNGLISGKPIPGSVKNSKQAHTGFSKFSDVFLVSALNGDGVMDIKDYLISNAKSAGLHYSPALWSDQKPEHLIVETVRAKFLDFLAQELPYLLKVHLEYFDEEEQKIVCSVVVECPSERLVKLISGAGGGKLQQIRSYVRNDLIDLFKKSVAIDIHLKVKGKPLMNL